MLYNIKIKHTTKQMTQINGLHKIKHMTQINGLHTTKQVKRINVLHKIKQMTHIKGFYKTKHDEMNKWPTENNVDGLTNWFSQKVKIKPRMRAYIIISLTMYRIE